MHPTLIPSMHAVSSCKAGIEPKLPVPVATKRRIFKTSIINTRSTVDAEAHHNVVDVGSPAKCPTSANERAPKVSTNTQQLVCLQAQPSKLPGGMGEE